MNLSCPGPSVFFNSVGFQNYKRIQLTRDGKETAEWMLSEDRPEVIHSQQGQIGPELNSDGAAQRPLCSLICYLEGRRVPNEQNVMSGFFYGAVDVEMIGAAV